MLFWFWQSWESVAASEAQGACGGRDTLRFHASEDDGVVGWVSVWFTTASSSRCRRTGCGVCSGQAMR